MSKAIEDVIAERKRQVNVEGWSPEHDDEHAAGELASAAACYIDPGLRRATISEKGVELTDPWPWWNKNDPGGRTYHCKKAWYKPKDRRRNLVRAAALILAEIERFDRRHDKAGA